jgi:hypothetical protein
LVNNPPTVTLAAAATQVDSAASTTITATAVDPEGNTLAATATWSASCGDATLSGTSTTGATFTAPAAGDFIGTCLVSMSIADVGGAVGSGDVRINIGNLFTPEARLDVLVVDQCGYPLDGAAVWLPALGLAGATDATGSWISTLVNANPIDLAVGWRDAAGKRFVQEYRQVSPGEITVVLPNQPVLDAEGDIVCGDTASVAGLVDLRVTGGVAGLLSDFEPALDWAFANVSAAEKTYHVEITPFATHPLAPSDIAATADLIVLESDFNQASQRYETTYGFVTDLTAAHWGPTAPYPVTDVALDLIAPRLPVTVVNAADYARIELRGHRNHREYRLGTAKYDAPELLAMTGFDAVGLYTYAERSATANGRARRESFAAATLPTTPTADTGVEARFTRGWPDIEDMGFGPTSVDFDLVDPHSEIDLFRVTWRGKNAAGEPVLWSLFTTPVSGNNAYRATPSAHPTQAADWAMTSPLGLCGSRRQGLEDVAVTALALTPTAGLAGSNWWALLQTAFGYGDFELFTDTAVDAAGATPFLALPTAAQMAGNTESLCYQPTMTITGTVYDWEPATSRFVPVPGCEIEISHADFTCTAAAFGATDCAADGSYAITVEIDDGTCDPVLNPVRDRFGLLVTAWRSPSSLEIVGEQRRYDVDLTQPLRQDIFGGLADVAVGTNEPDGTRADAKPLRLSVHESFGDGAASDQDFIGFSLLDEVIAIRVYGQAVGPELGVDAGNGGWVELLDSTGQLLKDAAGRNQRRCFGPAGPSITNRSDAACSFGADEGDANGDGLPDDPIRADDAYEMVLSGSGSYFLHIDTIDAGSLPYPYTHGGYVVETRISSNVPGDSGIFAVAGSTAGASNDNTAHLATAIRVSGGEHYQITASGSVACCGASGPTTGPDGSTTMGHQETWTPVSSVNGIATIAGNTFMPLFGVWGDETDPRGQSAPPTRPDFDVAAPDMDTTAELWQAFYIGDGRDGRDDADGAPMTFAAPAGATRLYLGFIDFWFAQGRFPCCYHDNPGPGFDVEIKRLP